MENEEKKYYNFHSYEILWFSQSENFINFGIATDCGKEVTINISTSEFLEWFDKKQIDEIKNKFIEYIKTK